MFIHFLCLCPLRLAIMLNFNISKVAYWFFVLLTSELPWQRNDAITIFFLPLFLFVPEIVFQKSLIIK